MINDTALTDSPSSVRMKSVLFFLLYNLMGIIHSFLCLLSAPFLTFEQRFRFVNLWTQATMWLLRTLNHVDIEVVGLDNIPKNKAVVVMANHQSQWETFYLQLLISPQATILKRELLKVPFFGWGLALLKPIAIDRSKGTSALQTILREGKQRLAQGISVVIFPEGTRQAPGEIGKFNSGGARLAEHAGADVLPVVHNSGDCWPARSVLKRPGKITLIIGKPISTDGKSVQEINQEVAGWVHSHYPN
jgi:1-acyl-sn-glycerol-3-phosphate acyltransferase